MDEADVTHRAQLGRPASRLLVSPDQPAGDPLGSWYGGVRVLPDGQDWPVRSGVPLAGVAQLAVGAAPYVPKSLRQTALLLVFGAIGRSGRVLRRKPEFEVIALDSFDGLEVVEPPPAAELFAARPGHWEPHEHDLPRPEQGEGEGPAPGVKIGGWPSVDRARSSWTDDVEFVAQLGPEASSGVAWGDGGYVLIGRRPDGSFTAEVVS